LFSKHAPMFVSDATAADVMESLDGALYASGKELAEAPSSGRLAINDHWFWNGPCFFRRLPDELQAELTACDLVLIKGDANYRRLVEDRHWPAESRLDELTDWFPAPLCVIRTLKSQLIVDLDRTRCARLAAADPDWLVNGRRGLIQLSSFQEV
jgi:hypothetical protein